MWRERKRLWCRLPWTFTVYSYDTEKLYIESGFLSRKYEEIRLYRVLDISVDRSFLQRLFGLGNIILDTSDKTANKCTLKNITKVLKVKNELSDFIEKARESKKVHAREFIVDIDEM